MPVSRTFLFFLVVVLQVILVEGKKGGKGKGKDSDVSDDGSGSRVGVIAGIVGGTALPNPTTFSVLTITYSGIVLVVISVGVKCRSWIQGLLKGSPNEQHGDKLSKANKLSKNSDLEGGNLKEYPPQDVPFYVSIPGAPLTTFSHINLIDRQPSCHPQSSTTRWIGKENLVSFLLNLTRRHQRSLLLHIQGELILPLNIPHHHLSHRHNSQPPL